MSPPQVPGRPRLSAAGTFAVECASNGGRCGPSAGRSGWICGWQDDVTMNGGAAMPQVGRWQTDRLRELDECELVQLARMGIGAAFRAIIQRNNRRLFRTARSILKDDSEAEDVVQEVYVRAFEHISEFRGDSTLATWLIRIAINEAQGRLRRRRPTVDLALIDSEQTSMSQIIPFPATASIADPERVAAQREVREMMERAIDALPDGFRVVFVMRLVEEMSVEETASALGLREETVKTRLHRARNLLRQSLDVQLAPVLKDSFPFGGARCAHVADVVLARLRPTSR
jgi:RNA polymerase sigma-70 factor, ECF subfamily